MIFVCGILASISVYLVLSKSLIRIVMGTTLITHASNLFLITMGGLKHGEMPIYEKNISQYVDPIPHALILTAIVIAFATTAFFLVLAFRTYKELGTDNVERMKGRLSYFQSSSNTPFISRTYLYSNYIGLFRTTLSCETICHFNWSSPDTNCGNNQFKKCICRWSA